MDYLKKYSCYRQNSLRDSMLSDSKSEEHRVKHESGRYYYVPSLPTEIPSVVFPSSRRFCSEREKQTTSRDEGRSCNIALHHLHTTVEFPFRLVKWAALDYHPGDLMTRMGLGVLFAILLGLGPEARLFRTLWLTRSS
jgi:hypothetical protein